MAHLPLPGSRPHLYRRHDLGLLPVARRCFSSRQAPLLPLAVEATAGDSATAPHRQEHPEGFGWTAAPPTTLGLCLGSVRRAGSRAGPIAPPAGRRPAS